MGHYLRCGRSAPSQITRNGSSLLPPKLLNYPTYVMSMKPFADDNALAESIENLCVSDPSCSDGDASVWRFADWDSVEPFIC